MYTKARGLRGPLVVLVACGVALAVVALVWGLTLPRALIAVAGASLVAYAVTESPSGPAERPARSWPQDESGQGGL